jgi:hypothetical protein
LRVADDVKYSSTIFSQCVSCNFWGYEVDILVINQWDDAACETTHFLLFSCENGAELQYTGQSLAKPNCGGTKPRLDKKYKLDKTIDCARTLA